MSGEDGGREDTSPDSATRVGLNAVSVTRAA